MVEWSIAQKLMKCFPRSFINQSGEFIAHVKSNQYIVLANCETELDVKCKVIEWFSRPAHKTEPYSTKRKNDEFHKFMLDGINEFLGTSFTKEDMDVIYTYLGNACNHQRTIRFIENGYDVSALKQMGE